LICSEGMFYYIAIFEFQKLWNPDVTRSKSFKASRSPWMQLLSNWIIYRSLRNARYETDWDPRLKRHPHPVADLDPGTSPTDLILPFVQK